MTIALHLKIELRRQGVDDTTGLCPTAPGRPSACQPEPPDTSHAGTNCYLSCREAREPDHGAEPRPGCEGWQADYVAFSLPN